MSFIKTLSRSSKINKKRSNKKGKSKRKRSAASRKRAKAKKAQQASFFAEGWAAKQASTYNSKMRK